MAMAASIGGSRMLTSSSSSSTNCNNSIKQHKASTAAALNLSFSSTSSCCCKILVHSVINFGTKSVAVATPRASLSDDSTTTAAAAAAAVSVQPPPPPVETNEVKAPPKEAAAAKPKPPAKAPAKPLAELMEEDVIPPLKAILEAEEDVIDLELSFQDNKLEGSFLKLGIPYSFWAFFPDGVLTGPKGFSISSYGTGPSTVEPFLVDEKKITEKHVVFWVRKRLAAQGIIPVWKE